MGKKATYTEIIEAVSQATGISKSKSDDFAKKLLNLLKKDLENNGKASLSSFGSFNVKKIDERAGRNPQTGEPLVVPAHKRVSFNASKALKESVNAPFEHLEVKIPEEKAETEQEKEIPAKPQLQTETESESESIPTGVQQEEEPVSSATNIPSPKEETSPESQKPSSPYSPKQNQTKRKPAVVVLSAIALCVLVISTAWLLSEKKSESETTDGVAEANLIAQESNQLAATIDNEADEPDEEVFPDENNITEDEDVPSEVNKATAMAAVSATNNAAKESSVYHVQNNEWFWVISEKVYGKSEWWPLIYQANKELVDNPDELIPDNELQIPALTGSVENPAKEDYQKLAKATYIVSDAYLKYNITEKSEEYARFARKYEKLGL